MFVLLSITRHALFYPIVANVTRRGRRPEYLHCPRPEKKFAEHRISSSSESNQYKRELLSDIYTHEGGTQTRLVSLKPRLPLPRDALTNQTATGATSWRSTCRGHRLPPVSGVLQLSFTPASKPETSMCTSSAAALGMTDDWWGNFGKVSGQRWGTGKQTRRADQSVGAVLLPVLRSPNSHVLSRRVTTGPSNASGHARRRNGRYD